MAKKNRQFNRSILTVIIAFIISEVIRSVTGFTYTFSIDGLDFRILISMLIFAVPYFIFYFIFGKVFFNTGNKK